MDLPNILNSKGPAAAAAAAEQHMQQQMSASQTNGRTYSETESERGISPHISDQSSRYSTHSGQQLHVLSNMASTPRFTSPAQLQPPLSLLSDGFMGHTAGVENGFTHQQPDGVDRQEVEQNHVTAKPSIGSAAMKAFACTNCGKAFARRSDLARHGIFLRYYELCSIC